MDDMSELATLRPSCKYDVHDPDIQSLRRYQREN
jgi:hypothetical protein